MLIVLTNIAAQGTVEQLDKCYAPTDLKIKDDFNHNLRGRNHIFCNQHKSLRPPLLHGLIQEIETHPDIQGELGRFT